MNQDEQHIVDYFEGKFSGGELEAFNARLENDAAFASLFEEYRATMRLFRDEKIRFWTQPFEDWKREMAKFEGASEQERVFVAETPIRFSSKIGFESAKATIVLSEAINTIYKHLIGLFSEKQILLQTSPGFFKTNEDSSDIEIIMEDIETSSSEFFEILNFLKSMGVEVRVEFENECLQFEKVEQEIVDTMFNNIVMGKTFEIMVKVGLER